MSRSRFVQLGGFLAGFLLVAGCSERPSGCTGDMCATDNASNAAGGAGSTDATGTLPAAISSDNASAAVGGASDASGATGTMGSGMAGMTSSAGATDATGTMAMNAAGAMDAAGTMDGTGTPTDAGTAGSENAMPDASTMAGDPTADEAGVPLAKPGDAVSASRQYLNLGDMRLLVNKWGSDELGCDTTMRVFVNDDRSFGWDFARASCGGNKEKPDYPEVEFGVHPFGDGSTLATTPSFSSTTLLPLQIKDINSSSVTLDNLSISLQGAESWNLNFELWLSQRNPLTETDPGVHAEVLTFWGWQSGRWPCDQSGSVSAGDRTYGLCHQDDGWAGGKWRYFQFRVDNGPNNGFSGRLDVKALLDWLVNTRGYSPDLWVTRFEVGSEIDDNTSGTVTMRNITFEVNGTTKSPEFGQ